MLVKFFKFCLLLLFYQSPLYSKSKTLSDFNSSYLTNYFSGIVAHNNKNNSEALKFFETSKFLIKRHDNYLERYAFSLVQEGKVQQATNEIKQNLTKYNSNFFEAHLILALDSLKKKNYKKSKEYLNKSYAFIYSEKISLAIVETLKQYLYVFEENKIPTTKKNLGNFSFINEVFQRCYLGDKNTKNYFNSLINNEKDQDYSRYIFFYLNYLIANNENDEAKKIASNLDYLNSSLLISQGKKWIEEEKLKEFKKIFSCKDPNDILGELFFLVANLYSSQGAYDKSIFYLNISDYLNPKFKYNKTLLAENHFLNKDYSKTSKILKSFDKKDNFYYWFKLKKETQIISKEISDEEGLNYINEKFKKINNPSIKTIFDIANLNKNSKKYQNAINYYDLIISKLDIDTNIYADILFRRGISHERLGNYLKSDKDFLKSLEINPEDSHVLNYLAYSWLEREYKIDQAMQMLKKAYDLRSNDPYIIDSIGWGHSIISSV